MESRGTERGKESYGIFFLELLVNSKVSISQFFSYVEYVVHDGLSYEFVSLNHHFHSLMHMLGEI